MKSHSTQFVALDTHRCKACWLCVETCPKKALGKVRILWHKHARFADGAACVGCLKCVKACPHGALSKCKKQRRESPKRS